MHGGESRVFHYAVLASIALHGLMLFSFSMKDASRRAAAPEPIVARLVQSEPVSPPRVEEQQPAPTVKPTVRPPPPPESPPVAKPAPLSPPQPEPPAPTTSAAPAAEAQPAVPAPSAPPAPGPAATVEAAPAPSAGDFDAGALARYRIEVAGQAAKLKRYPRAAIDNNWTGRVVVAVTVRANGVPGYSVRVSSGHRILDQQALDMISKAQSRAEIPAALRGREFSFEIPVDFDLKETSG